MKALLDLLKLLPTPVQIAIVCLFLGGATVWAAESRYMTVAQFTKSYVLDLKAEIRELRNDLKATDLTPRERRDIQEQLAVLLDDLCYELGDRAEQEPYCKNR